MAKKTEQKARVRVTLKKSGTGYPIRQKATLKALGFHHVNQVVEHEDCPAPGSYTHLTLPTKR